MTTTNFLSRTVRQMLARYLDARGLISERMRTRIPSDFQILAVPTDFQVLSGTATRTRNFLPTDVAAACDVRVGDLIISPMVWGAAGSDRLARVTSVRALDNEHVEIIAEDIEHGFPVRAFAVSHMYLSLFVPADSV